MESHSVRKESTRLNGYSGSSCNGSNWTMWYAGEHNSGISESDDKDLFWAIGGHRLWGDAVVKCTCEGGNRRFTLTFHLRLTDQQFGTDDSGHFTYLCHRIGVMRDFITCGNTYFTYSWDEG